MLQSTYHRVWPMVARVCFCLIYFAIFALDVIHGKTKWEEKLGSQIYVSEEIIHNPFNYIIK